jgi:hypothetical protein
MLVGHKIMVLNFAVFKNKKCCTFVPHKNKLEHACYNSSIIIFSYFFSLYYLLDYEGSKYDGYIELKTITHVTWILHFN